jgi:hypothetical protein
MSDMRIGGAALLFGTALCAVMMCSGPAWAFYYNVKDYGATGDPGQDDTQAIGDAIRAASLAGGPQVVFFPPGIYRTANQLLYSNVSIQGTGRSSVIRAKDNSNTTVFGNHRFNGPPVSNVSIRFLEIDGNKTNNQQSRGIQIAGQNITIEGVHVHDTGEIGIAISSAEGSVSKNIKLLNNWVQNASVSDAYMGAIAIQQCTPGAGESGALLHGNLATSDDGAMSFGITVEPNPGQVARNVIIEDNTVRGGFIGASGSATSVRDLQIIGNRVDAAGVIGSPQAIRVDGVGGTVKINNNTVVGFVRYTSMIWLRQVTNPQISGNFITGMGTQQNLYPDNVGLLLSQVVGGSITNNTFLADQCTTPAAGIRFVQSSGQSVWGNLFYKMPCP